MAPKSKNTKQTETPVVEKTVAPDVPVQEAGAKKTNTKKTKSTPAPVEATPAPVETAPAPVEDAPAKKATGKKAKATPTPVEAAPAPAKKAAGKKAKAVVEAQPATADEEVEAEPLKNGARSFKVLLPNNKEYSGRFTGLTPYQAANKALSKYFRSLENTTDSDVQVNFSIRESTRGSKRHEYNYKGSRVKLDEPITYTIKSDKGEERVITKNFKNQLIKVKKSASKQETATA